MLNATISQDATAPTWREALSHGDIVAFRFPVSGDPGRGFPPVRPCLVLNIAKLAGKTFALLAHGVTAKQIRNKGYEVDVVRRSEYRAAGLLKPTRFVGGEGIYASLDSPGFERHDEAESPLIGHLRRQPLERLNHVRARIHALRDIRADGRRDPAKRAGRGRSPLPNVDFTAEDRRRTRDERRSEAAR